MVFLFLFRLQEKRKKRVEKKEFKFVENLAECTFSPTLISKKQSEQYLKNRSASDLSRAKRSKSKKKGERDTSKGKVTNDVF